MLALRLSSWIALLKNPLFINASKSPALISVAELPQLLKYNSPGTFITDGSRQEFGWNATTCW